MSNEIVKRARDADSDSVQRMNGSRIFKELADLVESQTQQIDELTAQVGRMREALQLAEDADSPVKVHDAFVARRAALSTNTPKKYLADKKMPAGGAG